MFSKVRPSLFSLVTIFVFIASLITPLPVRADGEAPTEEAPASEVTSPAADSGEAEPAEPAENNPPEPVSEPEPVTLPEVIEQAPQEVEVIVLDQAGEPEPLASQEALEIIANSDPVWCPGAATPGSAGCSPNQATMTDLLNYIQNPTNGVTGAGTIYFQNGIYGGSESSISLDGAANPNISSFDLALEGGWDLGTNTFVTGGTTTFNIPFLVTNWSGNVSLNNINVDADASGAALVVTTTGDIDLSNVDAGGNANGAGAYLDNCGPSGCTGAVSVTDGTFSGNNDSGLVIDAGGDITLNNVTAQTNGYYGADLLNRDGPAGGVQVNQGVFSNNDDTGLSVISEGAVNLTNVTANGNNNGAFVDTHGNVDITGSTFSNNDWTGLQVEAGGNIGLDQVTASSNGVTGAYLDATSGFGGISITDSSFNGNGQLGLKGMTSDGDINLSNVTVDANSITNTGAWLKTFEGGNVDIQNSSFLGTDDHGLLVVSSGTVNLENATVSNNAGNGAEIYSTYSYACFGPQGIQVTVNGGQFQSNGGYGLFVSPGPLGTLTLVNNPTFLNNLLGEYELDLTDHCTGCDEEKPGEPPVEEPGEPKKPVNVVELPETGGEPVPQDCENYSETELDLPAGESVMVGCPFEGESVAEIVTEENLPASIPLGPKFVGAVSVELTRDGEPVEEMLEETEITISFPIPAGMEDRNFSILFWDPTAKDGAGDWVELPLAQFGGATFPLNPENPEDPRTILSGVKVENGMVTVTVNFPGIFALVVR